MHALVWADGTEAALAEIAHVRHRLCSGGSPLEFSLLGAAAAMTATRTGHVRTADTEAATALASVAPVEPEPMVSGLVAVCVRFAAQASLDRGDTAAAARQLQEFEAPGRTTRTSFRCGSSLSSGRRWHLPEGLRQTALSLALALGDTESSAGIDNPAVPWRVHAALAAQRLGDSEQAQRLSSDQLQRATDWGPPATSATRFACAPGSRRTIGSRSSSGP